MGNQSLSKTNLTNQFQSNTANLWKKIKLPLLKKESMKAALSQLLNPNLSSHEKDMVIKHVDLGYSSDYILQMLKIQQGSKKEQLVKDIISQHYQSKPHPTDCKQLSVNSNKLPLYLYPQQKDPQRKYFTLLLIGESGSGKTTLLDAFVNYLTGMEYSDGWRWTLVDEEDNVVSQGQTTEIKQYYVNDFRNQFNIRIIDTPGFGQSLDSDLLITSQLENLFEEIIYLDYILFTAPSVKNRLNPETKYIYDQIQKLFGKDALQRFVLMCTFADDDVQSGIQSLQNYLKCDTYYSINNSGLYTPPENSNFFTKFFWKMTMASIDFFASLLINKNWLHSVQHTDMNQ